MRSWGQYILSVGLASLLVAVIGEFSDRKSSTGTVIRMLCGLFLAFTAISPVADLNIEILDAFSRELDGDAASVVSVGRELRAESMQELIRQETEAYILDKARVLGCEIEATVSVGDGEIPVPESVLITGDISTSARRELEKLLEQDLGISKENQQWIG